VRKKERGDRSRWIVDSERKATKRASGALRRGRGVVGGEGRLEGEEGKAVVGGGGDTNKQVKGRKMKERKYGKERRGGYICMAVAGWMDGGINRYVYVDVCVLNGKQCERRELIAGMSTR
jgi:hypothetical protein